MSGSQIRLECTSTTPFVRCSFRYSRNVLNEIKNNWFIAYSKRNSTHGKAFHRIRRNYIIIFEVLFREYQHLIYVSILAKYYHEEFDLHSLGQNLGHANIF
jgi:hypothetical protein